MTSDPTSRAMASELVETINDSWKTQVIRAAVELGLAEALDNGPAGTHQLAKMTKTHEPFLRRLLRAMVSLDLCREDPGGVFELTSRGRLLRADDPNSVRSWCLWWGGDFWPLWGSLADCIRTGESARQRLGVGEGFSRLDSDPARAAVFHQAMLELTRLAVPELLDNYDYSRHQRIADVGGGQGELLAAILERNPACTGILFDLPHALANAQAFLHDKGVEARCELVAGDFFNTALPPADLLLLKSVLHDWTDERAIELLKSCRKAAGDSGRLLVIEPVLPERMEANPDHRRLARADLNMLLAHGACERTLSDLGRLLKAGGFSLEQVHSTRGHFSLIEASPA